ncbi:MAG: hypothetical protein KAS69_00860 [Planctomycetes bacterium]|nr:hypothetical protein [Planctomycetota bacterium]
MKINTDKIIECIDSAIKTAKKRSLEAEAEAASTTINLLERLYGTESQKCKYFIKSRDDILKENKSGGAKASKSTMNTIGVLRSIKSDMINGLLDQPKSTAKTPISFSIKQIEDANQQFDDTCNELMNSDFSVFNTRLNKLIYLIENNPVICHIINNALSASDESSNLQKWYDKFCKSVVGVLGSGNFVLPPEPDQELVLLFKMLKASNDGKISEGKDFGVVLLGTNAFGKTKFDEMVDAFNESITAPFEKHVCRRLERMSKKTNTYNLDVGDKLSKTTITTYNIGENIAQQNVADSTFGDNNTIAKQESKKSDETLWHQVITWTQNNPVLVGIGILIVLLGLAATVKTNWKKVFPPQNKQAGQLNHITPDNFEKPIKN